MEIAVHTVAPLDAHSLLIFLLQCGGLLMTALLLGRLAMRVGMPALLGELLAGALLGPSLLGFVAPDLANWVLPQRPDQFHLLDAVGQVSVLLLVGVTGMLTDLDMVRRRGATAVRVSSAGLVIPLALGVACGLVLPASLLSQGGDRTVFAIFLGVAMCVSAIPVIAKTLIDMKLLHRNVGQLTLAAGMVDDTIGWFLLSLVSAMATGGIRAGQIALSVGYMVGIAVLTLTIGQAVVRGVMRLTARAAEPGPTVTAAVILILLAGAATQALGFEAILGAFLCGILIGRAGGFEMARLAPLRAVVTSVLAPLFFATAGLRMDMTELIRHPVVLAAAALVLALAILGKFAGALLGALSSRIGIWEALALGAAMNSRGIVQVIVATVGLRLGVLNTASYTIVILTALVTSLMAPPILRWAMGHVEHTDEEHRRREVQAWAPTPDTQPEPAITGE